MTVTTRFVRFTTSRPAFGWMASIMALLLSMIWHPAWLAPILVIALTSVWIMESRQRRTPTPTATMVASNAAPVREALEDVRSALVDELGHASRELHQGLDLLSDAVSELGGGFDGLSKKT